MACGATLKRPLDSIFDHSPAVSPKRRRCVPFINSTTPVKSSHSEPSPFLPTSTKITPEQIAAGFTEEWRRLQRRKRLLGSYSPPGSPYSPPLSTQQNIIGSPPATSVHQLASTGSGSTTAGPVSTPSPSHTNSSSNKEQPLFTLKQVMIICERMLKEREAAIREEYDKTLTCKLAEQYEAFLKFNHDQLQRRFGESAASYVS